MPQKTLSPFDRWPPTRLVADKNGNQTFTVRVKAFGPFVAKWTNRLALASAGVFGTALIFGTATAADPKLAAITLSACSPLPLWLGTRTGLRFLLSTTTVFELTPERFSYTSLFGKKRFDRNVPHRFVLHPHKKTQREEQRLRFIEGKRSGKWWAWSPPRYCGESRHLVLEYMDQRYPLMTIYGPIKAEDVRSRLSAVKDQLDGQARGASGIALEPEDDWSPQPGGLAARD